MIPLALDKLIEQWKADASINKIDPDKDLLNIPNLHAKYAAELVAHSTALKKKTREFLTLKKTRTLYYTGKMSQEDLEMFGLKPFPHVVKGTFMKGDVNVWLDGDHDLNALKATLDDHEEAIELCKMIIKQINDRTYQIRGYLDYSKYLLGH
jgi:hypothetical protein